MKARRRDFEERPAAIEAISSSLQLSDKAVQAFRGGDERYSHLDPADVEKVSLVSWCL